MDMRLSVLDLAPVDPEVSAADALHATVAMAKAAERRGFERVWYAEHHNMPNIASSATAVLIAHVAAHTERIRLGAGGIMLPNHSPLVIAEQFGTLAALHPDRIDLGLGRAPGTDGRTVMALRRDPRASDQFPQDVVELQRFLAGLQPVAQVQAVPVAETPPPLYILGSSLFGATLAATLGLPYAFASHFAPDAMHQALAAYRDRFEPSEHLAEPFAIVGANVTAAASVDEAAEIQRVVERRRVKSFLLRGRPRTETLGDDELDVLVASPQGQQIVNMMRVSAVGNGAAVRAGLERLQSDTDADEIMVAFHGRDGAERLTALEITADAML